nr:MarR family transcriptional regulator [Lysinibacter cavernae]
MRWLSTHGPTQAGKIAEALHMDKSAVSRQTRSLREYGFVTSEQDPTDGRAMVVQLTPLGQGKLDGRKQVSRERFYSRLEDWTADELNSLHELLAKLNRSKPFGE